MKVKDCEICGAELRVPEARQGETVTCGAPACDREARAIAQQERDEAHEDLDRRLGWDGRGW